MAQSPKKTVQVAVECASNVLGHKGHKDLST